MMFATLATTTPGEPILRVFSSGKSITNHLKHMINQFM